MQNENKSWLTDVFDSLKVLSAKVFSKLKEDSVSIPNIYEQVWNKVMELDEWVWLVDLYIEESTNQIFAIFSKEGLLYRASVSIDSSGVILGELIRVKEVFEPISNRILIKRQADNSVRWFLISSSNVLNRSASIDSAQLFDNLIKRAADDNKYPYLTYYHLGDPLKMGMTDWLAREDNLLLASGLFDQDNVLAECMQRAYSDDPEYWGASISFWPLDGHMEEIAEGISVPMYTDGRFEEISILAEKDANCLFTALHSKGKVNRMRDELKAQIKLLVGEDEELANRIISQVDESNKTITENGLIRRGLENPPDPEDSDKVEDKPEEVEETEEVDETEEVEEESKKDPQSDTEVEIDEVVVDAIAAKVIESQSITDILESVQSLSESVQELSSIVGSLKNSLEQEKETVSKRLGKLEVDEEEKKENWLNDVPRASKTVVTYRPRTQSVEAESERNFESIASDTLSKIK